MMRILKNFWHFFLAWFGAVIYGFPSKEIFVFGVTGTKGKSSVLELANTILEFSGRRTAVLSSLRLKIADRSQPNLTDNTMPGRFFIQKFLRQAVTAGCGYALIEVTSEGVIQHRHRFIDFGAALFLNLHPEHIERHGSFEKYLAAKVKFFRDTARRPATNRKLFFINENDKYKGFFEQGVGNNGRIIHFNGQKIANQISDPKKPLQGWLASFFNLENAAAAAAFAESQGIDWKDIKLALRNFKGVPGRLEIIQEQPFKVVIDYAHTPDSLRAVYDVLSQRHQLKNSSTHQLINSSTGRNSSTRKLICVLGAAGGGRDKWKRPAMGSIAAHYCKAIILTNEDPYDENPEQIFKDIESGFSQDRDFEPHRLNFSKILDRQSAIKKAVSLAQKNDTVIITGKGSEHWMHLARGERVMWSERRAVEQALKV